MGNVCACQAWIMLIMEENTPSWPPATTIFTGSDNFFQIP